MGYQSHQYHSPQQNQNPPNYDPNQFSRYPPYQHQPSQPWDPYCESHLLEWPSGNLQDQNLQSYHSQFYTNQGQHHPHHQRDSDRSLNLNQHAKSIEEKIEELIASQQSMRSCLKSNDELALGMRNTHDEYKASIDKMLEQTFQLADSIREIQENKVRLLSKEHELDEGDVGKITREMEISSDEPVLEIPPEEPKEVRDAERVLAEKDSQHGTELIAAPQGDEGSNEDSEEATDEYQEGEKEEEAIEHLGNLEATLFCLQTRMVYSLGENVKELASGKAEEDLKHKKIELKSAAVHTEIPHLETNEQEGCSEKEGPD